MLDNMTPEMMKEAVIVDGRAKLSVQEILLKKI